MGMETQLTLFKSLAVTVCTASFNILNSAFSLFVHFVCISEKKTAIIFLYNIH